MTIKVVQEVVPEDKSPTLPTGEYVVGSDVQWICISGGRGVVTFEVTEGPYASNKRRIGVAEYSESA